MLRKKNVEDFEFAFSPEKHTANQSDPLFGATFIFFRDGGALREMETLRY